MTRARPRTLTRLIPAWLSPLTVACGGGSVEPEAVDVQRSALPGGCTNPLTCPIDEYDRNPKAFTIGQKSFLQHSSYAY